MPQKYTQFVLVGIIAITLVLVGLIAVFSYQFFSKSNFTFLSNSGILANNSAEKGLNILYANENDNNFVLNNPKINEAIQNLVNEWPYKKPYDNTIVVYGINENENTYVVNLLTRTDPTIDADRELNIEDQKEIVIHKSNLENTPGESNLANAYLTDEYINKIEDTTFAEQLKNFLTPEVDANTSSLNFVLPFHKETKEWRAFPVAWHGDIPGTKYDPFAPQDGVTGAPQNQHKYLAIDFGPELMARRSYYVMQDGTWVPDMSGVAEYLATDYQIVAPTDITITGVCASGLSTNPKYQSWISFKDNANQPYGIAHIDSRTLKVAVGQKLVKGAVMGSMLKGDVTNSNAGSWTDSTCGTSYAAYWPHIHYKVPAATSFDSSGRPTASLAAYFDGVFICKDYNDAACYRKYACGTNNADTCYMHVTWENKVNFIGSISKNSPIVTDSVMTSPAALSTLTLGQQISITLGNNLLKTSVRVFDSSTTYFTVEYQNENSVVKSFSITGWPEDGRTLTVEVKSYKDATAINTTNYTLYAKNLTNPVITAKSKSNLNIRSCPSTTTFNGVTCSVIGTLYTTTTSNVVCKYLNVSTYWVRIDTNPITSLTNNKWVAGSSSYINIYKNGVLIQVTDTSIPTCPTSSTTTSSSVSTATSTASTATATYTAKVSLNVRKCASTTSLNGITCSVITTLATNSTGNIVCKYYNSPTASYWARIDTNALASTVNNKWIAAGTSYITVKIGGVSVAISDSRIPNCPSGN